MGRSSRQCCTTAVVESLSFLVTKNTRSKRMLDWRGDLEWLGVYSTLTAALARADPPARSFIRVRGDMRAWLAPERSISQFVQRIYIDTVER